MKALEASRVVALANLDATQLAKLQIQEDFLDWLDEPMAQVRKLPSEDDLATTLGCSRATVRSALILLQKEGKVRRVHGSGTFVNSHACSVKANVSEDLPFLDVLERLGYEPEQRTIDVAVGQLSRASCEVLRVASGTKGWRVERIFLASGRPAVLSTDSVPLRAGDDGRDVIRPERSTFSMVENYTGHTVSYSVAKIVPTIATGHVAEALDVASGTATLLLRHTHVDDNEQVVAATDAYINSDLVSFSVVRTADSGHGRRLGAGHSETDSAGQPGVFRSGRIEDLSDLS